MKIRIPKDVLVRELDGESVILNLKSEKYFGLDEVGTDMWAALTNNPSVEAALSTLIEQYDIDDATLRRDLDGLIEKLVENELVEVVDD